VSEAHAAIDLGTNSFHLVVARRGADGGFEVITTEKEMVRLGRGAGEMKHLAPEAMDRGVAALQRMVQVARSHGADVSAVATSAVREAENRAEFLRRARDEAGVEVEVISGFEEARLIHLGVLQALPVFDRRLLVVDIGGGSTELVVGLGAEVLDARSMKLGAIRLTERFFPEGRIRGSAVADCRRYVRAALAPAALELANHRPEVAAGSSGTIATVAAMAAARRGEVLRTLNGSRFTAAEVEAVVDAVTAAATSQRRRRLAGLDARRADIIVGGALLLAEVFGAFELDEMVVSGYALREGVLLDRWAGLREQRLDQVRDLRRSNVERLADQLDPDVDHARRTARLAVRLFDLTRALHRLDDHARELLAAAAVLHNVGLFISHSAHHRHSYYVIRHSERLTGFNDHEIELMAQVARYHRKSHPSDRHPEFAALGEADRYLVRVLAGLLRVAIGLDRSHRGLVSGVVVTCPGGDGPVIVGAVADPASDIDLELYAANERASLLAEALDRPVSVVPAALIVGPGAPSGRIEALWRRQPARASRAFRDDP
jgi:exopolyphosphatase/guanosine-5'-triphosphate,3'-diphosphate pyrophosphatase